MGLLGDFEDPKTQGLLSLGLGLLNSRGNFGQGLGQAGMQAMEVMRQARQDQQRAEQLKQQQAMQSVQMQTAQQQLAEMQRASVEAEAQRGRDETFRASIPQPVGQSMAQGNTDFGNFNLAGPVDPRQMLLWQAMQSRQIKPMDFIAATQKDNTPIKLGEGEKLLEAGTYRPLAENPKASDLPSAVREYEYAQKQGFTGSFQDFVVQQKKAGATNVSLGVKMGESIASQIGPMVKETWSAANGALQSADAASRVVQAVDSGKIIAGPLANGRLTVAQIADTIGVGGKDNAEKIASTRQAMQGLAQMTLQGRKQMTGQGAITESEGKLAERALSGDINFTAAEIKQLALASKRAAKFVYDQHQQQIRNMQEDPGTAGLSRFYKTAPWPVEQGQTVDFGSLK